MLHGLRRPWRQSKNTCLISSNQSLTRSNSNETEVQSHPTHNRNPRGASKVGRTTENGGTQKRPRQSDARDPTRRSGAIHPFEEAVSRQDQDRLIFDYLAALDSPRSLTVWLLYSTRTEESNRAIVELTLDPHHYNDAESFRKDWAATKLFSKCADLKTGIDTEAVAIKSAEEAELRCRETNRLLIGVREGKSDLTPFQSGVFHTAKRIIADILGPVPPFWFQLQEFKDFRTGSTFRSKDGIKPSRCFAEPGWSPGRTTSAAGTSLSSFQKYGSMPDITASACSLAARMLQDSPKWGQLALAADGPCSVVSLRSSVISGNVMLVVPKNAKTGRVICYEPHLNMPLQLSVGGEIRACLKKVGINLNDQSINQRRATLASKYGNLATIDLRSASDTVSLELVWELLPYDWVCLLDDLRSKYTTWPDGSVRKNEKFSSMGNGFTFELESLIFYGLCRAVTDNVTVYGDDIILPTAAFDSAVSVLGVAGFSTNIAKSFKTSWFRESCGADVFRGLLMTPYYLRKLIRVKEDVVKLHNGIREWAMRLPFKEQYPAMLSKWRHIHPCLLGPKGQGDGHYHVSFDEATPDKPQGELEGWWFFSYVRTFPFCGWGDDLGTGTFPAGLETAVLLAATGPRRPRSVWSTGADRRKGRFKKIRALSSFTWRGDLWSN